MSGSFRFLESILWFHDARRHLPRSTAVQRMWDHGWDEQADTISTSLKYKLSVVWEGEGKEKNRLIDKWPVPTPENATKAGA